MVSVLTAEKTSLTAGVASQIRGDILEGRYRAGDRLPAERELAERLEVNRTSVREALKLLEQEGFIAIRRGDGARVQAIDDLNLQGLGHLLFINDQPNVDIILQMLYVHQLVLIGSVEIAVQNATEEQLKRALKLIDELTVADPQNIHATLYAIFNLIIEASHNLVLKMIYKAMDPSVGESLHAFGGELTWSISGPMLDVVADIKKSLAARDGKKTAEGANLLIENRRATLLMRQKQVQEN